MTQTEPSVGDVYREALRVADDALAATRRGAAPTSELSRLAELVAEGGRRLAALPEARVDANLRDLLRELRERVGQAEEEAQALLTRLRPELDTAGQGRLMQRAYRST
jgi:hypothetical protein